MRNGRLTDRELRCKIATGYIGRTRDGKEDSKSSGVSEGFGDAEEEAVIQGHRSFIPGPIYLYIYIHQMNLSSRKNLTKIRLLNCADEEKRISWSVNRKPGNRVSADCTMDGVMG